MKFEANIFVLNIREAAKIKVS